MRCHSFKMHIAACYDSQHNTGLKHAYSSQCLLLCYVSQVTNHTNAKLVLRLAVPGWTDPIARAGTSKPVQPVFTVREGLHPDKLQHSQEHVA